MKASKFTEAWRAFILKEGEQGLVPDLAWSLQVKLPIQGVVDQDEGLPPYFGGGDCRRYVP